MKKVSIIFFIFGALLFVVSIVGSSFSSNFYFPYASGVGILGLLIFAIGWILLMIYFFRRRKFVWVGIMAFVLIYFCAPVIPTRYISTWCQIPPCDYIWSEGGTIHWWTINQWLVQQV